MSNVLPKTTQDTVWSFYRTRFLFVGAIAALIAACITLLVLAPSFVAVRMSHTEGVREASSVSKEEIERERTEIMEARALIQELAPVTQKAKTFEALMEVLSVRPNGVTIQDLEIRKNTGGENRHTITITGNAGDRAKVSEYRSALSKLSFFDSVTVPVGALAGAGEGQFSITLSGVF